jgi:hypothetical protein
MGSGLPRKKTRRWLIHVLCCLNSPKCQDRQRRRRLKLTEHVILSAKLGMLPSHSQSSTGLYNLTFSRSPYKVFLLSFFPHVFYLLISSQRVRVKFRGYYSRERKRNNLTAFSAVDPLLFGITRSPRV